MSVTEWAKAIAIVLLIGWTVYKEVSEKNKAKRYNLADNPERCNEHAKAINEIRGDVKRIKEKLEIV